MSIRYGGVFSMGCLGAALHTTMSDELTEITIVNAYGELHIYSEADDAEAFNVACVNLTLLGIIYSLETFFDNGPDTCLKLNELVMSNDSTELFYWLTARFMKPEKNEHFWLKQSRHTTDPVESPEKYKDQPPTIDHSGFADLPDAIHFDVTKPGEGIRVRRIFDASAAFKIDPDFLMNELVAKNQAFSSSELPRRLFAILEVRFIRATSKMMSFVYDAKGPEAVYCVTNVMGSILIPELLAFSGEVLDNWIDKYNTKPHWTKLWEHIPGVIPTLRTEYKDRLEVFNRIRKTQDPFDMLANDTWQPLFKEREE
ncbi:hypothetical protein BG015_005708 [Linnemannia schmuckeri]|uniref:D-arabinono-1,4-lactone oxidase C-terminal domain-containing protein n=1 Tax=Linnemannia schmuckeri TaxID=64567 RepID=A0A9P5S428_9FUNG|nr:hypothetical protein BG015_005708 [Linnemannia schmuckeri]